MLRLYNKGVMMEFMSVNRMRSGDGYASRSLRDDEKLEKLDQAGLVLNCAYTDYGGYFTDKVFIKYFKEKFPDNIVSEDTSWNGENAIVFGNIIPELVEAMDSYCLGFRDIEDYFYKEEYNQTEKDFNYFVEENFNYQPEEKRQEILSWLMENKEGCFSMMSSGLDFCWDSLFDEVLKQFPDCKPEVI